ncbi:EF-hand domain-containing protein [Acidovorax sp. PRC11]|uniref:EF-hand domain-containing protein n=1 Tax=Acidovorax sp. PRC11 TaxID=2962592 RepID=UPI002881AFA0|nr:EF-hand domain-containing protein [Acidovorax sp. PRC11]MDT0136516.1 EF-hand domain-containing protein [Acidovorax sp. PRC11]
MPATQQRRSALSFDARSVLLFAAMAVGGAAAHAQTSPSASTSTGLHAAPSRSGSNGGNGAQGLSASAGGGAVFGGTPTAAPSAGASFDRADANHDGQLSAQEAARLPAISQRFKALDTNRDGALSRTEFEVGAKS